MDSRITKEMLEINAKIQGILSQYHASAGYYDRSHGHNVWLGRYERKLQTLCKEAGISYLTFLSEISK